MGTLKLYLTSSTTQSPWPVATSRWLSLTEPSPEVQLNPGEFDNGKQGTSDSGQWLPSSGRGSTEQATEIDNSGETPSATRQGWLYAYDDILTGHTVAAGAWAFRLRLIAAQNSGASGRICARVSIVHASGSNSYVTDKVLFTTNITGGSTSDGQAGWRDQNESRITVTNFVTNFDVTIGGADTSQSHTFESGQRFLVEIGFCDLDTATDTTWRLDYNNAHSYVVTPSIAQLITAGLSTSTYSAVGGTAVAGARTANAGLSTTTFSALSATPEVPAGEETADAGLGTATYGAISAVSSPGDVATTAGLAATTFAAVSATPNAGGLGVTAGIATCAGTCLGATTQVGEATVSAGLATAAFVAPGATTETGSGDATAGLAALAATAITASTSPGAVWSAGGVSLAAFAAASAGTTGVVSASASVATCSLGAITAAPAPGAAHADGTPAAGTFGALTATAVGDASEADATIVTASLLAVSAEPAPGAVDTDATAADALFSAVPANTQSVAAATGGVGLCTTLARGASTFAGAVAAAASVALAIFTPLTAEAALVSDYTVDAGLCAGAYSAVAAYATNDFGIEADSETTTPRLDESGTASIAVSDSETTTPRLDESGTASIAVSDSEATTPRLDVTSGTPITSTTEGIMGLIDITTIAPSTLARDGTADWSVYIQTLIDDLIAGTKYPKYTGIYFPPNGIYLCNSPLIVRSSTYCSISLQSQGVPFGSSFGGATLKAGFADRPLLILQGVRAVDICNLYFLGTNTVGGEVGSVTEYDLQDMVTASRSTWVRSGHRDNRYSPYCGIAIDPFGPDATGSDRYPGLESYYEEVNRASSSVVMENVWCTGFVVGIAISLGGLQNCEDFDFRNCSVMSCRDGVAVGQDQTRNLAFWNFRLLNCDVGINCTDYGEQTGCPPNITAGDVGYCRRFIKASSKGAAACYQGIWFEQLLSLGLLYNAGVDQDTTTFRNCGITFANSAAHSVAYHLENFRMLLFDSCRICNVQTFPREPIKFSNRGDGMTFLNCTFNRSESESGIPCVVINDDLGTVTTIGNNRAYTTEVAAGAFRLMPSPPYYYVDSNAALVVNGDGTATVTMSEPALVVAVGDLICSATAGSAWNVYPEPAATSLPLECVVVGKVSAVDGDVLTLAYVPPEVTSGSLFFYVCRI